MGNSTYDLCHRAKAASKQISNLNAEKISSALLFMASALLEDKEYILSENQKDIEAAKGKISDVITDRLYLNDERIEAMANGIRQIAVLSSPIGSVISKTVRENGLIIEKTCVPIGVIAIIYESRPNVTADAAALSLKSGNACILRCGKEAHLSAAAIVTSLKKGLSLAGITSDAINLVSDITRQSATELMTAQGLVDLLIPRGGASLIKACVENATVPCIQTGTGICHIYVDKSANIDMALSIISNAKVSRPSVCNAMEVCLIHKDIAPIFLPQLNELLGVKRLKMGLTPVELRLDEASLKIINGTPAKEDDFDTEFLDYIMAVKIVSDITQATEHISMHSTHHSEAIITSDENSAEFFTKNIDSAAVYVNASTRFTDGGEFGLGCEMGISTQKLHARGPLGVNELTTYKYIIKGTGQIR